MPRGRNPLVVVDAGGSALAGVGMAVTDRLGGAVTTWAADHGDTPVGSPSSDTRGQEAGYHDPGRYTATIGPSPIAYTIDFEIGFSPLGDSTTYAVSNVVAGTPNEVFIGAHRCSPGDEVLIEGVVGVTATNGYRTVDTITATSIKLLNSNGSGAYTGGGTVRVTGPSIKLREGVDGRAHLNDGLLMKFEAVSQSLPAEDSSEFRINIYQTDVGGTSATRGYAITKDDANLDGYYYQPVNWRCTSFDGEGSFQMLSINVTMDPYVGGGDRYAEADCIEAVVTNNRTGAYATVAEFQTTANAIGRTAVTSLGLYEVNPLSSYTEAIFGVGSSWVATGARALQIAGAGPVSSTKPGTGLYIHGFERSIVVNSGSGLNVPGQEVFTVDFNGYVGLGVTRLVNVPTGTPIGTYVTTATLPARLTLLGTLGQVSDGIQLGNDVNAVNLYRSANNRLKINDSVHVNTSNLLLPSQGGQGFYWNAGLMDICRNAGDGVAMRVFCSASPAEANPRAALYSQKLEFGPGTAVADARVQRVAAGVISLTNLAIEAANIVAAAVGGAQGKKIPIYNDSGTLQGYVPIYAT